MRSDTESPRSGETDNRIKSPSAAGKLLAFAVETLLLLALAAFAVSFLCSMGGVSGAFLLLPFQVFHTISKIWYLSENE